MTVNEYSTSVSLVSCCNMQTPSNKRIAIGEGLFLLSIGPRLGLVSPSALYKADCMLYARHAGTPHHGPIGGSI